MPNPWRETVIDGYNLIHKLWRPGGNTSMPAMRERLESMLSAYRKASRRHVTLVYDGGPAPRALSSSGSIEIVFSGSGSSADQRIVDHVRSLQNRAGLVTVVTSDREIRRHVIAWGAVCISSESFVAELEHRGIKARDQAPAHKSPDSSSMKSGTAPLSDAEVDRWLKLFDRNR